jgi:branched-chain amino acid transport system substrate-binding protein
VAAVNSPACGPLQYGGTGAAEALLVSDLPLQGDSRQRSQQMNDAIRLVLEGAGWKAGGRNVAFQACDDSEADTGLWSKAQCKSNANAYAANPSVLGVIGTYNSGCAEVMVPILGRAPGGGMAMVSPGNTLICLTQSSPSCGGGEPKSLYPVRRNYARVVPNDAYQGAGLASFAKQHGIERAYVLYAGGDATSLGQAKTFRGAARKLGISTPGFRPWNPNASSYKGLMAAVGSRSPDAVLLAGLTESNGARLIKDKVAVLGPNSGVKLLAPDGFAQQSTIDLAGRASRGMFASVPGLVPQDLQGPGKKLVVRGPGGKRAAGRDRRQRRTRRRDRSRARDQGPQRDHRQLRNPAQRRPQRRADHGLDREEQLPAVPGGQAGPRPGQGRTPRLTPQGQTKAASKGSR